MYTVEVHELRRLSCKSTAELFLFHLKGHGMRYAVWSDVDMAADQIQEKGAGR